MSKIAELTERRLWQLVGEARALAAGLRREYDSAASSARVVVDGRIYQERAARTRELLVMARKRQARRVATWEGYRRLGHQAQNYASYELGERLMDMEDEAEALVQALALAHWRLGPKSERDGIKRSRILRLHNQAAGRQLRRKRRREAWELLFLQRLI